MTSATTRPVAAAPAVQPPVAAALDVAAVLLFVVLGRTSHAEGGLLTGTGRTAWPFLVGLAAGWLLTAAARRHPATVRAGVLVTAATVAVGMTLRHTLAGRGTPLSFVVVASTFLALFLVGWRGAALLRARRAA